MRSARKLYLAMGLALVAMLVAAGAAYATVTFDPATGTGFVGKGDVQVALGLNNSQLQAQASSLVFTYSTTDTYSAVCEWITGDGTKGQQTHDVSHTSTTTVQDTVAYDPRQVKGQKQITGFNLTGFQAGSTVESGDPVPVVGGACPGNNGTAGTWVSVTPTGSTSGLYVNGVLLQ